jgi:hypothetical protein
VPGGLFAAGPLHEDAADGFGRGGEEVPAAVESLVPDQWSATHTSPMPPSPIRSSSL